LPIPRNTHILVALESTNIYIFPHNSYEIARAFVLNGARVIMVNRKEEQGEDAIKKIKEEAGEKAQIEWVGCDMGNLKEVKEVFTGIREREERLDLVRASTMFSISLSPQPSQHH
jgi:NAD(P)-dependent dehydrogenase (short-subunit alcohol dehydrogenase family)